MKAQAAPTPSSYVGLCYHYLRPPKTEDPFPRLLGTRRDAFVRQLAMLQQRYEVLSPEDAQRCLSQEAHSDRYGVLLTFDDALADHYEAARLLAEQGIKAFFFLPTCVLQDRLPANPTVIHYGIAAFGLEAFLAHYRQALEACGLSRERYDVHFQRGMDDPWQAIASVKTMCRYRLKPDDARRVLLHIYHHALATAYPEALSLMHLSLEQVRKMVRMGHAIGVHSHSHVSVAGARLSEEQFAAEVIAPKRYLEAVLDVPVTALSYPFGGRDDCLTWEALIGRTREYELAFTVEEILNTPETPPLELGRYMPRSTDTDDTLQAVIERIIAEHEPDRCVSSS